MSEIDERDDTAIVPYKKMFIVFKLPFFVGLACY